MISAHDLQSDGTPINGVTTMSIPDGLRAVIEQHHVATNEFIRGNVGPWQQFSHADDVTIIGGCGRIREGLGRASRETLRVGRPNRFKGAEGKIYIENISLVVTGGGMTQRRH